MFFFFFQFCSTMALQISRNKTTTTFQINLNVSVHEPTDQSNRNKVFFSFFVVGSEVQNTKMCHEKNTLLSIPYIVFHIYYKLYVSSRSNLLYHVTPFYGLMSLIHKQIALLPSQKVKGTIH